MDPNPSVKDFTDDFVGEFLHWDGKFPTTMKALMTRPGLLTQEFLLGRRRRWLSPFRLYLTISLMYFFSGPLIERLTGHSEKTVARLQITGDSADRADLAILSDSSAFVNAPEIRESPLVAFVGAGKTWTLVKNPSMMKDIIAAAVPKVMFLLMPFFALLTWIAWRATGKRYPAHLVFSFHVHSAFFAAMFLGGLLAPIGSLALDVLVQLGLLVYSTWYTIVACREALGGSKQEIFVRTSIVGLLYAPVVLVAVLGATLVAIKAV
jgi:hypothetical protein